MALWYHCRKAISITIQRDINKVTEEIVDILPDNVVLAENIFKTFGFFLICKFKVKRLRIFFRCVPQLNGRLASWTENYYQVVKCSLSQETFILFARSGHLIWQINFLYLSGLWKGQNGSQCKYSILSVLWVVVCPAPRTGPTRNLASGDPNVLFA